MPSLLGTWTFEKLAAHGFSEEVIEALRQLTMDPATESSYEDYVMRAAPNPMARAVKLADLEDNCDLNRISNPTQADFDRIAKYQKTIRLLKKEPPPARPRAGLWPGPRAGRDVANWAIQSLRPSGAPLNTPIRTHRASIIGIIRIIEQNYRALHERP